MTAEDALLAQMRAAPEDEALRLVYADLLLEREDPRGELILLDTRDRLGVLDRVAEMERLLHLSAEYGFPRLPDDPDAHILEFYGSDAVHYWCVHAGRRYYLHSHYGFPSERDPEDIIELGLDAGEWTFRETNVILSMVSAAIRAGTPLSELTLPDAEEIRSHADYRVGRHPTFFVLASFELPEGQTVIRKLACRDFARWHVLYRRWKRTLGVDVPEWPPESQCACGVAGLKCGVDSCR
jgi:uncharacterized protein (TIGR02996 family)